MKPLSKQQVAEFARFVQGNNFSYAEENKEVFLRTAHRLAERLAVDLELPAGSFEIRRNRGGVAGSGEVILHSDHLYVNFQADIVLFGDGAKQFMYRGCRSRLDFTGLWNHWMPWRDLAGAGFYLAMLESMRAAMAEGASTAPAGEIAA